MGLTLYGLPLLDDPRDINKEVWADAYGFTGFYVVSNLGQIASNYKRVEQLLRPQADKRGRYEVRLTHPVFGKVHRNLAKLILSTFIGIPDYMASPVPAYYNRNYEDMRLFNLTWVDSPFSKLDGHQADEIRSQFRKGHTISSLSDRYGITGKHVLCILRMDAWQPALKTRV